MNILSVFIHLCSVETLDKISALEDELSRLKAQIAVYAMSEVSVPAGIVYTYRVSWDMLVYCNVQFG